MFRNSLTARPILGGFFTVGFCLFNFANTGHEATSMKVEHELGITLMPHWKDKTISYAVVTKHQGNVIKVKNIRQREFILIASGNMRSEANPGKVNFFFAYDIPNCVAHWDAPFTTHIILCPTIDNLWKLRYKTKPGEQEKTSVLDGGHSDNGWANLEFAPDSIQLLKLNEFGIKKLSDVCSGDDCFRLIKATTDANWLVSYMN